MVEVFLLDGTALEKFENALMGTSLLIRKKGEIEQETRGYQLGRKEESVAGHRKSITIERPGIPYKSCCLI